MWWKFTWKHNFGSHASVGEQKDCRHVGIHIQYFRRSLLERVVIHGGAIGLPRASGESTSLQRNGKLSYVHSHFLFHSPETPCNPEKGACKVSTANVCWYAKVIYNHMLQGLIQALCQCWMWKWRPLRCLQQQPQQCLWLQSAKVDLERLSLPEISILHV